jgi:hypothetical protein
MSRGSFFIILLLVLWFVLMRFLLPKMGVHT